MKINKAGLPLFLLFMIVLPVVSMMSSRLGLMKNKEIMSEIKIHDIDLPSFILTDQSGNLFSKADILSRVTVACFLSEGRDSENQAILAEMRRVQYEMQEEDSLKMMTIVLNPLGVAKEKLMDYAKANQANFSRWHFLGIDSIQQDSLIKMAFQLDKHCDNSLEHCSKMVLIDKRGHIMNYYNALDHNRVNKLMEHIAMIAPKKPRKKIQYKREEEL